MISETVWKLLDHIGIIVGLITAIPVFYAAWALWDNRRKNHDKLQAVRANPGLRPTILIIDVIKPDGTSIQAQVENWLHQQDEFGSIPESSIYTATFKGQLTERDVDQFIKEIRQKIGSLLATGTDKIHLFMRSPIVIGAIVGEILANTGAPVFLYHNQQNMPGYENWGQLHR